jgi:large subunit ribosomal protein L22
MPGPKLNESPVRARRTGARGPAGQPVRSTAKYIRISAYKVRVVLDLIRGHDVAEAANILRFCERDAATTIGKVLRSAVANAGNNDDIPAEELYVSACYADEGPTIKRFIPRARGRTGAIRKRTSHITVVVSRLPDSLLAQARVAGASAAENRARRTAGARAAAETTVADARREASGTEEVVAGATLTGAAVEASSTDAAASTASSFADTRTTEPVVPGADVEDGVVTNAQQLAAEQHEPVAVDADGDGVADAILTPLFSAPAGDVDALNKIIGIGPKLAQQLNDLGITQFAQLAEMSDADLQSIDSAIPRSFDQIADWRVQAQEIIAGTWNRDSANNT